MLGEHLKLRPCLNQQHRYTGFIQYFCTQHISPAMIHMVQIFSNYSLFKSYFHHDLHKNNSYFLCLSLDFSLPKRPNSDCFRYKGLKYFYIWNIHSAIAWFSLIYELLLYFWITFLKGLSHLTDSVNGCPMENKIFNLLVSVCMRFLSVSHSTNALLVRRCLVNPAESFVHAQNLEWTQPEKGAGWMYGSYTLACVLFGTRTLFVLYLSSLHPLMSGGPDSQLDFYLTCNGSTGGVPDTDLMFSRHLDKERMETRRLMGVKR